jgi:tRNA-dihydrouridine synthase
MSPDLTTPLRVGALVLDRRLFMAPMAGLTKAAFRRFVRRWGAGLLFTEMISSHGIAYGNRRTLDYLQATEDEHPIGYQLFGAVPEVMAEAAAACVEAGADLVDVNMACPVRKVMKTGAGAALLGEPELAERIVAAMVAALPAAVPLTVKIRAGLRVGDEAGRLVAPRLVAAGAAAIAIHPRWATQLYRGQADHAITLALARELEAPVIASGDIGAALHTPSSASGDGEAMREARSTSAPRDGVAWAAAETCAGLLDGGVAAVMLARAALGRPWLFDEILSGAPAPAPATRLKEIIAFVEEVGGEMGGRAVTYLRQFWPRFRRGGAIEPGEARELMQARQIGEIRDLLARALERRS